MTERSTNALARRFVERGQHVVDIPDVEIGTFPHDRVRPTPHCLVGFEPCALLRRQIRDVHENQT
jgi:hypothetical protein